MKTLKKDFQLLSRGYKIIFSIDAALIPLNIISAVLEAVFPFVLILMSAEIINALSRGDSITHIYFLLAITLASSFFTQQLKQLAARAINIKNEVFEHKFRMFLNNKTLDLDYGSIENPDTHIKRQRIDEIRNMSGGGIWKLVYQSRDAVSGLFTIITSVSITYRVFIVGGTAPTYAKGGLIDIFTSPLCAVVLLLFMVVNTILSINLNAISTKKIHAISENILPQNRLFSYIINNYINSYNAGKEIRIYNQKNMIMDSVKKLIRDFRPIITKREQYKSRYTNINAVLSSATGLLIYIFIGVKALYRLVGLGDLFKYINGIAKFSAGLNEFLNSFNSLRTNNAYLEVLYEFLDMPNASYQGALTTEKHADQSTLTTEKRADQGALTTEKRADNGYEIEFHGVSFRYPGTDAFALRNLNLKFNVGRRMAVVGMNGSGKTTMIKLLCRLYDPTEGEITLNEIDIRKYEFAEYANIFSVVFQDFKLFSFPLGQNVAASVVYDKTQAEKCLEMAGLKDRVNEMPKGLDTRIYKDFEEDGVEISGGEAQKIALARALYKDAPFIVLDEPTAALDPIAEFEIYSRFNEIAGDKTAIYISHRLSSCRFCDDIAVFHEGELIQRGSHDALLSDRDGKYYELWNAQAQYYNDKAAS